MFFVPIDKLDILCLAWILMAAGIIFVRYCRSRLWMAGGLVALAMICAGGLYAIMRH